MLPALLRFAFKSVSWFWTTFITVFKTLKRSDLTVKWANASLGQSVYALNTGRDTIVEMFLCAAIRAEYIRLFGGDSRCRATAYVSSSGDKRRLRHSCSNSSKLSWSAKYLQYRLICVPVLWPVRIMVASRADRWFSPSICEWWKRSVPWARKFSLGCYHLLHHLAQAIEEADDPIGFGCALARLVSRG